MMATQPKPDTSAIRADLEHMCRRWKELDTPAVMELRAFAEGKRPQTAKFAPDWMDEAVEWAADLNALGFNLYAVRNPVRHDVSGSASDKDILAAFFLWADCDDEVASGNVHRFSGPKWTAAVTTGRTPSIRVHTYWELEEPCINLDAWRQLQSDIAAHFKSDASVINPSRIMRIGGTVAYPDTKKKARGYVSEIVAIRTEYDDDRDPVSFEQMRRVFTPVQMRADMPLSAQAMPAAPGLQIDTGQHPQALDRERMAIQAMSGKDWHNAVIRLVASYVAKGLGDSEIHALTQPLTLSGYTPQQTYQEVQTAIDGARRKGWTPEPQTPTFQPIPQESTDPDTGEVKDAFPTLYDFFDASALPPRQWVYGKHYLRKFVSVLASAGGIGKTSMQIVEALAICTGRPLLGEAVVERCNVWLINLEDPMDEMQRRILAAMRHFGITPEDVRGRLFVDAGREFSLTFAVQTREGVTPNKALVDHLIKRIPELGIGAVFIDPFVGAHQINENDNMAVNAVVAEIRKVADETNCAIGLVHHIRKGNGEDASIDSVRGAGSLIGAARAARVINKVSEEDAIKLGIAQKEASGIFRVDDGKANLAPPASASVFRKMIGVQIDNTEWVGVAIPFDLPDEWRGLDDAAVNHILSQLDAGIPTEDGTEAYYSAQPQSKERWAGNLITGYCFDDMADNKNDAQAKSIIRQWLKTGLIEEFEYFCAKQRKDRKGVRSTGRVGEQR